MQITVKTNARKIFQNLARKMKSAQQAAPRILANEGQKFILDNFKREGWRGNVFEKWPKRKKKENKRALLVGRTRRLIGSLRRSVKEANEKRIKWGTDVPYAAVHNDGLNKVEYVRPHKRQASKRMRIGTAVFNVKTRAEKTRLAKVQGRRHNVTGFKRRMRIPRRKFMGNSPIMAKMLIKKYQQIFHEKLR